MTELSAEEIVEAAKETRTLVFAALGSTGFATISAISLRDCELLSGTGTVTLPVLDAQVPTKVFFLTGPVFLLLLFLYVHFNMRRVAERIPSSARLGVWPLSELPLRKVGEGYVLSLITNLVVWTAWPAVALFLACRVLPLGDRLLGAINLASVGCAISLSVWNLAKVVSRSNGRPARPVIIGSAVSAVASGLASLLIAFAVIRPKALRTHYTDFRGAELAALDLSGKLLSGADFTRASLSQADFRGADLRDARLTSVDAEYAEFCGAVFGRASFRGAHVRKAAFRCGKENKEHAYVTLENANLADAELRDVDLSFGVLRRLAGATLTGTSFWYGDLTQADLTGTEISRANFTEADAPGARFDEARGAQTMFYRANLSAAGFLRATLDLPNFEGARLAKADFSEAVLTRARFARADMKGAILRGAVLVDAELTATQLEHALYDRFTKLPPGFDPKAHGMDEDDLQNAAPNGAGSR